MESTFSRIYKRVLQMSPEEREKSIKKSMEFLKQENIKVFEEQIAKSKKQLPKASKQ